MQGESIVTAAGGKAVLVWSLATTGLKKLQHEIERQLVIPNFFCCQISANQISLSNEIIPTK